MSATVHNLGRMAATYEQIQASIRRRVEWARSLKEGQSCARCGHVGHPETMDWHHRDPSSKEFKVSTAVYRAGRARILAEIAKCDLLCRACHIAVHEEALPGCGTYASYVRGCRCDACRMSNRDRRRADRARAT